MKSEPMKIIDTRSEEVCRDDVILTLRAEIHIGSTSLTSPYQFSP